MAQAKQSVYEAQLRASMIGGVRAIAHRIARDAVKKQLRDKGLRVSHFSAKEIALLAEEYFAQHPELINEAATVVERLAGGRLSGEESPGRSQSSPAHSARPCKSLK